MPDAPSFSSQVPANAPSVINLQAAANSGRAGFTILELMATIGVISLLVSLILPVVNSAREAARRIQCVNRLKQIGLALHSYHELQQCLPAGWQWESSQTAAYGWAVPLLPYLEQQAMYDQVDRAQLLSHPTNDSARHTYLQAFLCPSDITEPTFALFADTENTGSNSSLVDLPTGNYIGVFGTLEPDEGLPPPLGDGAFLGSQPVSFSDLQRGLANTMIVGERTMARVPSTWLGVDFRGDDAACRLVGNALTAPNCDHCDECEFDSRHHGGANFLWADGHVRMVSERVKTQEYQRLSLRADF